VFPNPFLKGAAASANVVAPTPNAHTNTEIAAACFVVIMVFPPGPILPVDAGIPLLIIPCGATAVDVWCPFLAEFSHAPNMMFTFDTVTHDAAQSRCNAARTETRTITEPGAYFIMKQAPRT
jgi:hypothetical protein